MTSELKKIRFNNTYRAIYRVFLLVVTSGLALAFLVLPIALRPDSLPVDLGDVSPKTYVAPTTLTYESEVLTRIAREAAAKSVVDRYLPLDLSISRSQIESLQVTLNKITAIRNDPTTTIEGKQVLFSLMEQIVFSEKAIDAILVMTDDQWEKISQESISVLERLMRNSIRDYQVEDSRKNLPFIISYTLPEDFVFIVAEIVSPFIVANSLYSLENTELAKQQAIDGVDPISRTYVENQTIVLKGQIVSEEQYEALELFGLIKPANKLQDFISASSIVIAVTGFIVLYFSRRQITPMGDLKSLTVIAIGFLIFLIGARFLIPNRTIVPFFYPISAYALILVTLFNLEIGIIFSLSLSILAAHGLTNSLEITLFYMFSSLMGALAIGKGKRVTNFFASAIAIALAGSAIIVSFRISDPLTDIIGLVTLIGVTFLNGFASASLALLLQYILSQILGLVTPLLLQEISRPEHPLLKFLLQNAPGTYQHSLQVSNLAERAAESIGADAMLTRVGTLYHDIGKALNASFFIENQVPGKLNTHDDLDSVIAAQTIIRHVSDGINLANKYRLPPRIKDFIKEHHGTQITRYQYAHALETANHDKNKVDIELFRYPGPKPQSKETALVMLADGCEARARAEIPKTTHELQNLIQNVFDYCFKEGQLDKTNLSLKDLKLAQESFIKTLSNTYHPRIQYPSDKNSNG